LCPAAKRCRRRRQPGETYLDLVPTAAAAKVANAVLTTKADPPIDRLVEILVAIGAAAREVIAEAAKSDHPDAIEAALERASDAIASVD